MVTTVLSGSVLILAISMVFMAYTVYKHEKALQHVTTILEKMAGWAESINESDHKVDQMISYMDTRVACLEGKVSDMEKEIKKMKDTAVILEADHE